MRLRFVNCLLGRHDFRYVGEAFGVHLEQCERCHRLKTRSRAMHLWRSERERTARES